MRAWSSIWQNFLRSCFGSAHVAGQLIATLKSPPPAINEFAVQLGPPKSSIHFIMRAAHPLLKLRPRADDRGVRPVQRERHFSWAARRESAVPMQMHSPHNVLKMPGAISTGIDPGQQVHLQYKQAG